MLRSRRSTRKGADNLKLYLSQAVLPAMAHGSSAPFMPPEGHKAHRNRLAVRPEKYRARFTKTIFPRKQGIFDKAVLTFVETLPCKRLGLPNVEEETGYALTVPAPGFDIQQPILTRPSTIHDLAPWVDILPLQTMTRVLHMAFPETLEWDISYANDAADQDVTLWNTLVWRKRPLPPDPEALWKASDPLEECSVVFVVQPPWIMTPQDIKAFLHCEGLPPISPYGDDKHKSAQRVWAKLWDTCVSRKCKHFVLTTYTEWVFGAFTDGYTSGQILDHKTFDSEEPTIVESLVYHVASAADLVGDAKLPQYLETVDQMDWEMDIPKPSKPIEVDYTDSESEWDGMDDEPGISAGVSNAGNAVLSAWGSQQDFCLDTARAIGIRRSRLVPPALIASVTKWQERTEDEDEDEDEDDEPPPYEREVSPANTESAYSNASVFRAAFRGGSEMPEVKVEWHSEGAAIGGYLATVVEQGPGSED